jgi:hypothetical protein
MNRNGGLAAGFLAVLTLVGVSNLPNKSSSNTPAATETKHLPVKPARAPGPKELKPYAPCTEIAKRLRRFVKDTEQPVELWKLPNSCYKPDLPGGSETVRALDHVRFAFAIVPNPVSTHLPLLFDRLIETIQQASQDENYSYDSSWFPWDTTHRTFELLNDQEAAEELQDVQEAQPGVIAFRHALRDDMPDPYEDGLVVFVIGEQPTGGISDAQFEHALDWINQLGGLSDRTLKVLGPTFSGSLPSLRRALEHHQDGYSKVFVSSGTVSSTRSYEWFHNWIENRADGSYFVTAMEKDSIIVARFCQYLSNQGYDVNRVAFLSEDETAFGVRSNSEQSPCGRAVSLFYPRDIATLRSAYEQQAIFNPTKSEPNASTPSTTLRGDLSEPSTNDHDTVRSYGGQLTPLAQESILLDIANRLSEKRVQFVVLRSTSSLDQIFLSQFLRRAYPEGRVVIDGADLLFNRGADGKSLRGVMLLSTYPLLTAEQDWAETLVAKPSGGYRAFGEDTSEGTYIAARELFRDPLGESRVSIRNYAPPEWAVEPDDSLVENHRPATWVSVVGRRQFWPLAVLNSNTLSDPQFSGKLQPSLARGDGLPIEVGDRSPLYLPTTMWMFILACFFWSAIHFYFCSKGSIMGSPRARAYFAPLPRWQHPVLIALGSVNLVTLAVAVAAASGLFAWTGAYPYYDPSTGIILATSLLGSTILAILACKRNYALITVGISGAPEPHARSWQLIGCAMATGCLLLFVLFQIDMGSNLTAANRIPAYWRSVNLTSGVSGLLPEILLLVGGYFWFWFNLRGLAHFGEDRPRLPALTDLPSDKGKPLMPMFSDEEAGMPVERALLPLTSRYWRYFSRVLGVTLIICWTALGSPSVRTLGELLFGRLIYWWVCIYIAVVLTDGIQMWQAWSKIRRLLVYLDRLPLRRTLRALKGLAWGSIWKMSGNVLEERYRVISLQMESLRHLTNSLTAWAPSDMSEAADKRRLLLEVDKGQEKRAEFVNWFVSIPKHKPITDLTKLHAFQVELTSVAGMILSNVLIPAWHGETNSLIFGRSAKDAKEEERSGLDIPTDDLKPHVRAAEEFFVLPYLAFLQNILGRIRTIALGMLCLFVATTLAISSYPFDPLSVLGGIFLAVFVLAGGLTIHVYSQMSRDATLSHITNTQPGELGWDFWLRLVGFGVGPLIGLLTTLFPSITDFVFSWLQPSVQALK